MDEPAFWLTRWVLQRALGFVYLMAFLIAVRQLPGLVGERGILPARRFVSRVPFRAAPSLFFLVPPSDLALRVVAWAGLALSALAVTGVSDAHGTALSVLTWTLLWALYMSIVNVGQVFYGYGWESLLLEAGFLAIFLGPSDVPPPEPILWLYRWQCFRVMLGAGLIKLRGDPCWRDLTCLFFHHETQPLPNPLSRWFHRLPRALNKAGVLFNHVVELVVPFGLFGPGLVRIVAGALTVAFQGTLILTGNLSWLNYATIAITIPCFDDRVFAALGPWIPVDPALAVETSWVRLLVTWAVVALVAVLSVQPALNLVSRRQLMNASFDPLRLVNTYGAFGSITRVRQEVVLEGTRAERPSEDAEWVEIPFKAKPGDPMRRPPIVSPYHHRIDWQMWFAAMSSVSRHPWMVPFVGRLLAGERAVWSLLAPSPFGSTPPRFIRARLWRYEMADPRDGDGAWWRRTLVGPYLPPLSLDHPLVREVLGDAAMAGRSHDTS